VDDDLGTGAEAGGDSFRDLADASLDVVANCRVEGADGADHLDPRRHDVALGAALDRPEGDHRGLAGLDVAADDRLQGGDDVRGGDDGVDAGGREGPVAGATVDHDLEVVGGGVALAVADPDLANRQTRIDVQAEDRLDRRVVEHAGLDQHP